MTFSTPPSRAGRYLIYEEEIESPPNSQSQKGRKKTKESLQMKNKFCSFILDL